MRMRSSTAARCAKADATLKVGGAPVTRIVYRNACHQWDGWFAGPRAIGRNLASCEFVVDTDGDVHDATTGLPMINPLLRKLVLGWRPDSDGYLIGRDDEVRSQALGEVTRFLNRVFDGG